MSEDAYKRRIRDRKRMEQDPRRKGSLANLGYLVTTFDSGPFHVHAMRGKSGRYIRICFGYATQDEVARVSKAPVPASCRREIWQISGDGRSVVVAKIS